jgi:hypothetical protein
MQSKSYRLHNLKSPSEVNPITADNHPALAQKMTDDAYSRVATTAKQAQNFWKAQSEKAKAVQAFWNAAQSKVQSQIAQLNHAGSLQQKTISQLSLVEGQFKVTEANSKVTLAQISAASTADSVRVAESSRQLAQQGHVVTLQTQAFEVNLKQTALAQKQQVQALAGNTINLQGSPVQFQKTVNPVAVNIAQSGDPDRGSGRQIGGK